MNTELFTGKAEAYAKARPGYPDAAMDYICTLVPPKAMLADIGAGTGKFTILLATSHSHDPLPSDPGYAAHIDEMNAIFDRENVGGLLRRDVVTNVYSERLML